MPFAICLMGPIDHEIRGGIATSENRTSEDFSVRGIWQAEGGPEIICRILKTMGSWRSAFGCGCSPKDAEDGHLRNEYWERLEAQHTCHREATDSRREEEHTIKAC